jgi:hypothetical protein
MRINVRTPGPPVWHAQLHPPIRSAASKVLVVADAPANLSSNVSVMSLP